MSGDQYKFSTEDSKFGLLVECDLIDKLLVLCLESAEIETGGILVGYYNQPHDNAIVTDVSSAPDDSKRQRAMFHRGVRGLQPWLDRLWMRQRRYYLGEWHFHPFASPTASDTDISQLRRYSEKDSLRCPEPVLLIIGGDPQSVWTVKAYVAPRHRQVMEMHPVNDAVPTKTERMREPWTDLG